MSRTVRHAHLDQKVREYRKPQRRQGTRASVIADVLAEYAESTPRGPVRKAQSIYAGL